MLSTPHGALGTVLPIVIVAQEPIKAFNSTRCIRNSGAKVVPVGMVYLSTPHGALGTCLGTRLAFGFSLGLSTPHGALGTLIFAVFPGC